MICISLFAKWCLSWQEFSPKWSVVLLPKCAFLSRQELLTVLAEYPFFVRDRGWSSCSPQRSARLYGLQCRQLSAGDVCLALTPTPAPSGPAEMPPPRAPVPAPQPPEPPRTRKRRWSAPELPPGSKTSTHLPQGSKLERRQWCLQLTSLRGKV